jgi:hypothetical protein
MWQRLRRWISGSSDANADDEARPAEPGPPALFTLRNLEVARKFPQELPDDAMGPKVGEPHACASCGTALARVIITTGGPMGDPAVWETYPLALDGWQCPQCQDITYPAFLSPDEITALINESIAAARRDAFDEAELGFRRVISSWPTYMPGRVNFGSMCLDRVRAEQQGDGRAEIVDRYARLAEAQLRKSLSCKPAAPVQVRFMLGKLLYRRDRSDEGTALLHEVVQSADAPPPLREQAAALLAETS